MEAGISTRKILATLAVAIAACALAPRAFASQAKGKFERTLNVTGPASLDVQTGSGNIAVTTGDSDKVIVRGTIEVHYDSADEQAEAEATLKKIQANPPVYQNGNSLHIGNESGDSYEHVSIDYELVLPRQSDLRARTGSGDMAITGPLKSVDVDTGSGDANIESVDGRVKLTTGSGDVAIKKAGSAGADVRTGSGDVMVDLPSQGGLNLTVETGSGDISTETGLQIESMSNEHHRLSAKVRGGGAAFVIQTGSGDVRIR